jgi:uncharacterized membrane protein
LTEPLIQHPVYVLAVLLAVLAALFGAQRHPRLGKLFRVVPLLVFAYFVPALLSNLGVIPIQSPLYEFIKTWLLPASLVLLTLSVDIPAILGLGPKVLALFLTATAGIVIGGPLAYLIVGLVAPQHLESIGEEAWKGLAALSGSWIGGGANFVAIGESVGALSSTLGLMVVVDVAVANVWMAVLLYFAGRSEEMDARIGADRRAVDEVRSRVQAFQAEVARPTSLPDLLTLLFIGLGATAAATALARGFPSTSWRGLELSWSGLPDIGEVISGFTWVVILVTAVGVALSFTRVRRLEGAGASSVGSVLLYLLVATIGAHAEFARVREVPALVVVGALWMLFHALTILIVRRLLRAPIFFAAIGSQANVGGAASAPIVASAFHPALAPVGVLLAVAGYVLGTYAGLACAQLLALVHRLL